MLFNNTSVKEQLSSNFTKNSTFDDLSSRVNFIFVSTEYCKTKLNSFNCNYSSLVIFFGYILFFLVIPLTIYRVQQLKFNFRNQYNLNLLWICSILLIALIDFTEFMVATDGRVYSIMIIIALVFYIIGCIILIMRYIRLYSIEGAWLENLLIIIFTISIYVLIIIARVLSKKSLSKATMTELSDPLFYNLLNTHFLIYYFVYVLFATVQVN